MERFDIFKTPIVQRDEFLFVIILAIVLFRLGWLLSFRDIWPLVVIYHIILRLPLVTVVAI